VSSSQQSVFTYMKPTVNPCFCCCVILKSLQICFIKFCVLCLLWMSNEHLLGGIYEVSIKIIGLITADFYWEEFLRYLYLFYLEYLLYS
jgi:hypothetical protein